MKPIPYSRLHTDFKQIGIQSTDTIMLHLSLKSIGWVGQLTNNKPIWMNVLLSIQQLLAPIVGNLA